MTTKTSTFSFAGLELRCVTIDGLPWFVAADVCRLIGLSVNNVSQHVSKLDKEQRQPVPPNSIKGKGVSTATLISESGLYALVMRSDKPQAREFQTWVTGTVLPAIRQTGGYIQGEERLATGEMTEEQFCYHLPKWECQIFVSGYGVELRAGTLLNHHTAKARASSVAMRPQNVSAR